MNLLDAGCTGGHWGKLGISLFQIFPKISKKNMAEYSILKKVYKIPGKSLTPPPFQPRQNMNVSSGTQVFDPGGGAPLPCFFSETPGVHGQLQLLRKLQLCFKALHLLSSDHRLFGRRFGRLKGCDTQRLYQCIKVSPKRLYYMDIDGHIMDYIQKLDKSLSKILF